MFIRLLQLVLLVGGHLTFVVGMLIGGIVLVINSTKAPIVQLARVVWMVLSLTVTITNAVRNYRFGKDAHCILTRLEQILRRALGFKEYRETFISHYLKASQKTQALIGGLLFIGVFARFLKSRH